MKTSLRLTVGLLLLCRSALWAGTLFVSPSSTNPTWPFATWATAATNIQGALDAAESGDLVLVTNGVYSGGVLVVKPVSVMSVNGWRFTMINGAGYQRCVAMTNGARLTGFTLTNGWAAEGGGVWCASTNAYVTNCVIVANTATQNGGGACGATLYNCVLKGNTAPNGIGGGAYGSMLYNCTVTGNSSSSGGGASGGILYNSIVYYNEAPYGANYTNVFYLMYSCSTPESVWGEGNITNAPLFVDLAGGNLRLQTNSPCINAGSLVYVPGGTDLDGQPRVIDEAVDMGAYEFAYPALPVITQQPSSQWVFAGTNVSFTVGARSSLPLSWQWFFDDTRIPDATNAVLMLRAVTTNQNGNYLVVASNALGSVTSQVAVLTVLESAPVIGQQPFSQTVSASTNVTFWITASGSLPMSLQWFFNGTAIPDATNWSLALTGVSTNEAGEYFIVVTNALGAVTSQVAVLSVEAGSAPRFVQQPVGQTAAPGTQVTFVAEAEGTPPLFWQWLWNGAAIPTATRSNLTLTAVLPEQAGDYSVVVSNMFGRVTSTNARLTILTNLTASYVWQNSPNPRPPYDTWATAATNLQDAVAIALPGQLVLVTNGVYSGEVVLEKPLVLRSVNGPQFTIVNGYGTNRCVFLTNGASLAGFTLTNGAASSGAGVYCATTNGFLTNCVIAGNSASQIGGGAYGGTLYNCTLANNRCTNATGGAFGSTLVNCLVSSNLGGGTLSCTLLNSAVVGNVQFGGGVVNCTLYNCTLTGNKFGAASSTLYNCILYYNTEPGDGNYDPPYTGVPSTLNYCCTIPMPKFGVGNITNEPALAGSWRLSRSSPCRGAGQAAYAKGVDLDGEPWLNPPSIGCDEYYDSSCTGALALAVSASEARVATGFAVELAGTIVGKASASRWEFGDGTIESNRLFTTHRWMLAGEYEVTLRAYNNDNPAGVTEKIPLSVLERPVLYVSGESTNPTPPYTNWQTAARTIQQAVDATSVPGALVTVSNGVYRIDSPVSVNVALTLQSVNGPDVTMIEGHQAAPGVRCVSLNASAILSGFTLTNGASLTNGGGVYCASADAVITNCILIGNSAPQGAGAYGGVLKNCVLRGNTAAWAGGAAYGAILKNCTLASNSAGLNGGAAESSTLFDCMLRGNQAQNGGGADWCTLNNCTLLANSAQNSAGGVYGGTLNNCLVVSNSCGGGGGGAASATLNNCTLVGNTAGRRTEDAGGAYGCKLNNSIVYYNSAPNQAYGLVNYSCTTPLPDDGTGNTANEPLFVSLEEGNFQLQPESPCIDAGDNELAPEARDLAGQRRIVNGRVDMGGYEFQDPSSDSFVVWLQQHGIADDGSVDFADPDLDGMNNWQEWICHTDPTNAASALRMLSVEAGGADVTLTWQSVEGVRYFLESSANGLAPLESTNNPFGAASRLLATNVVGQAGSTSFRDTNTTTAGPVLYRVGVNGHKASSQYRCAAEGRPVSGAFNGCTGGSFGQSSRL